MTLVRCATVMPPGRSAGLETSTARVTSPSPRFPRLSEPGMVCRPLPPSSTPAPAASPGAAERHPRGGEANSTMPSSRHFKSQPARDPKTLRAPAQRRPRSSVRHFGADGKAACRRFGGEPQRRQAVPSCRSNWRSSSPEIRLAPATARGAVEEEVDNTLEAFEGGETDQALHHPVPVRSRGAHRAMSSRMADVRQSGHQ